MERALWPSLWGMSALAWLTLAGSEFGLIAPGLCSSLALYSPVRSARAIGAAMQLNSFAQLAASWLLMLAAMTPPLLGRPLAYIWNRSLARRRGRAMLSFIGGYFVVWLVAGGPLLALALVLLIVCGRGPSAVIVCVALALFWQGTPAKQTCLNFCHRVARLSAFGMTADLDCLRFGVTTGLWCVGSCWAWMLVPLLAPWHMFAMALVAAIMLLERLVLPRRPAWGIRWPELRINTAALS